MLKPSSIEEIQEAFRESERCSICGAGTKTALSDDSSLSMSELSGILEYDPSEYTFTALAGTPLVEIQEQLEKNNQFMPFDPPLVKAGATLGGTVAAGISGPGRFRYAGIRDFFLGVRMVTTAGRNVFGGGKVVKNAAGFDIPKLNVGALGRYGALVELTFKVFPKPEAYSTVCAQFDDLQSALAGMGRVAVDACEPACLDLTDDYRVFVRLGGIAAAQSARVDRVINILSDASTRRLPADEEEQNWQAAREFEWAAPTDALIKVPLVPSQIPLAESIIDNSNTNASRRYSVGGNVVWIAAPAEGMQELALALHESLNRNVLGIRGKLNCNPLLANSRGEVFEQRIENVFANLV